MDDLERPISAIGTAAFTTDAAGIDVIKLSGEIDISNVESLRGAIEPVLEHAPNRVDFDLSALDFMDSSGIALMLRVAAKTDTVHLRGPSTLVRRMMEATGLSDVLLIEP
ncbi:MAG TPA: STAS domain-containing protein [Acidimicrobiia bacterium]|jgi:anti-anti-sigma factor|nr:STAS domain-containing protein [Acidimicrobiia bacterium]